MHFSKMAFHHDPPPSPLEHFVHSKATVFADIKCILKAFFIMGTDILTITMDKLFLLVMFTIPFFLLQHIRVCICVRPPFLGGCKSVPFRVQSLEKSRKTNIRKTNARNLKRRETRSISKDPTLFHNVLGIELTEQANS